MIRIKIDNREFEVEADRTLLSIAEEGGIKIPTLCHYDGIEDDASCLICAVKDKLDGSMIPACATIAEEGMEIDTKSNDVISFRKKIIELILKEHRAECIAPCRSNCPLGYNIPLLNRLMSDGKIKDAIELIVSETIDMPIACIDCDGFCEKACRRRKIDSPISIRAIRLFLYGQVEKSNLNHQKPKTKQVKKIRFASSTGDVSVTEQMEWKKECFDEGQRCFDIEDYISAGIEAKNCMHCDCRAVDDCKLREIADELGIIDTGIKFTHNPIIKRVNKNANLVFESAKCIKCGLCTRVCDDSDGRTALGFRNRGKYLTISEPLGIDFMHIPADKAEIYSNICPTGALRKLR